MNNQEYLLVALMEECAEVAHRASKALRFGLAEVQQGQDLDNEARLHQEFTDLCAVYSALGYQLPGKIDFSSKNAKLEKYKALSRRRGHLHGPAI